MYAAFGEYLVHWLRARAAARPIERRRRGTAAIEFRYFASNGLRRGRDSVALCLRAVVVSAVGRDAARGDVAAGYGPQTRCAALVSDGTAHCVCVCVLLSCCCAAACSAACYATHTCRRRNAMRSSSASSCCSQTAWLRRSALYNRSDEACSPRGRRHLFRPCPSLRTRRRPLRRRQSLHTRRRPLRRRQTHVLRRYRLRRHRLARCVVPPPTYWVQ